MTLPDERYAAVLRTKNFMMDLCDPKKTPRIPKNIRQQALWCLRHYPDTWDMQRAAGACPDVFAERMEDVTKLFKKYEQSKVNNES